MKKKKLLFIIWSFTHGGGAEKILSSIVNNLDENRYDIDIIEYWHSNIKREKVNKNINILPPIIDSTKDSHIKMIIYKILLELFPSILRKKYIKKEYDVEISFNYLIPTFLLSKKKKTIAWIHGDVYDLKTNRKNYILQKRSLKYVNRIVAISNNTYNSIKDVYPCYADKTIIINNGFNIDSMLENSLLDEIPKETEKIILFINRFDDNKNPLFAIDVAKELVNKGYNFKMQFLGKGNLEDKMKEKINNLNLEKYVEILGYKDNPYPYIKNCYMVIGCSKSEGFPTIFIESLAFGKPFVSTNVGGVKEISNNERCGLIANNLKEFVSNIELLLKDKEKYDEFRNNATKHVRKFTIKNQIEKIEKLINEMER